VRFSLWIIVWIKFFRSRIRGIREVVAATITGGITSTTPAMLRTRSTSQILEILDKQKILNNVLTENLEKNLNREY